MSCDITITSQNSPTLNNIESFMKDSSYRDILENAASFNTRLILDKKLRMPFLDSQTGLALNHSNLFMSSRQRMPGLLQGQVYTYPAKRWRKRRRQYLMNAMQTKSKSNDVENIDTIAVSTVENTLAVSVNEDSKDSIGGNSAKDEPLTKVPDAWYYEELEMQEMEGFEEPDPDSDYDYEDSYTKKRKKRSSGKSSRSATDGSFKRGMKNFGRGRRKGLTYVPDYSDTDKPYYCDICGARYKTRPGLTYHYSHSHKDKSRSTPSQDDETSLEEIPTSPTNSSSAKDKQLSVTTPSGGGDSANSTNILNSPTRWPKSSDDTYLTLLNNANTTKSSSKKSARASTANVQTASPSTSIISSVDEDVESDSKNSKSKPSTSQPSSSSSSSSSALALKNKKKKNSRSAYCDFCLGNVESNKGGMPEELISCADCGRSGHPTCLQFTTHMANSVKTYQWQCIECKCCSKCGASDNDEQLLFCDDCDRGYHMYCLTPPLLNPPEGSWSCNMCLNNTNE